LNNFVAFKSKYTSVDHELKKLGSKIKQGLEKWNLTSE